MIFGDLTPILYGSGFRSVLFPASPTLTRCYCICNTNQKEIYLQAVLKLLCIKERAFSYIAFTSSYYL